MFFFLVANAVGNGTSFPPPQTILLAQHRAARKAKLTVGRQWDTFEDKGPPRQVLFWSGGKDSFLTLRALQQENSLRREAGEEEEGPVTLLTTFDGASGMIAFQDTKASRIRERGRTYGWHTVEAFRS